MGDKDILCSELTSIRVVVTIAWDLGFDKKVWCETDSLEVWRLVNCWNLPPFHVYGTILADIYELLQRQ